MRPPEMKLPPQEARKKKSELTRRSGDDSCPRCICSKIIVQRRYEAVLGQSRSTGLAHLAVSNECRGASACFCSLTSDITRALLFKALKRHN